MSLSLVQRPKENLNEPWARSCGRPIASRTWEGSKELEVQAEPVEAARPSISRFKSIDSPSIYSKDIFTLLGNRDLEWPLRYTLSILAVKPLIRVSRKPD